MKEDLLQLDADGAGRVPLSVFYSQPDTADFQFAEPAEYLRQISALDESTVGGPRVRIANYLASLGQYRCRWRAGKVRRHPERPGDLSGQMCSGLTLTSGNSLGMGGVEVWQDQQHRLPPAYLRLWHGRCGARHDRRQLLPPAYMRQSARTRRRRRAWSGSGRIGRTSGSRPC